MPSRDLKRFLAVELLTPKLTSIRPYLWLAGLPRPARPLHRQRLLGRTILITEDPNEHLVWLEAKIFIKPLPEFLLHWEFWNEWLCGEGEKVGGRDGRELYRAACGFLLSYAWLVAYQSDLKIAKEVGLLPAHVEWGAWTTFMKSFLCSVDFEALDPGVVGERYQFGELRLTRLNGIYRLQNFSLHHCVRGYISSSTWYQAFFARNFAWLLAVFAFATVMLSAMQVGLSTGKLQSNTTFQNSSYGFAVASMVSVAASVVLIIVVWTGLFVYHLASTWIYYNGAARKRVLVRENSVRVEKRKENV
jgi:type III secretory pathway component EscS